MFREAFKSNRLLIPASGYYEWHDAPGGKQPYYFTRRDGQPIVRGPVVEPEGLGGWQQSHVVHPL
jgi:putative SOS response-associated peptidase YedK